MRIGRDTSRLLVAAVAATLYLNALGGGFVVDDHHQVLGNDLVTSPRHLPELFTTGVWDFEGRPSSYYRPLMYVVYMLTWIAAGPTPWAFHLVSVLMHVACCVLVTVVTDRVLARGRAAAASWTVAPAIAGLLFAAHPIHTEAVSWIACVADLGYALCGLSALAVWVAGDPPGRWRAVAAAACCLSAALFKEPGITLVAVLPAYDLLVRRDGAPVSRSIRSWVPLAAAAAVYLILRLHALGGLAPTARGDLTGGAGGTVLAVLHLFATCVRHLVVPYPLNFWHVFAPPEALLSRGGLASLAIAVAFLAGGLLVGRRSRAGGFAFAATLLPILPAFHLGALNQGLENAFTERYLYFPSFGVVLLATLGLGAARALPRARAVVPILAVALVASGATQVVLRNPVWKDHLSLWSDAVAKSPGSAIARLNYGYALYYAGRVAEGRAALDAAVAERPDLVNLEIGKGIAFASKGLTNRAILAFHAALALDPRSAPAHFHLGLLYEARGWPDRAVEEYREATALDPRHGDAHNNLAALLAERGRLDEAIAEWEAAARASPEDPAPLRNLARARRMRGEPERAAEAPHSRGPAER